MKQPLRVNRFTLIEMVTAMAIMVFVALIIGTASMTFYNGWRRSVAHTESLKTRLAIDRVMDSCVRNMIPFTWYDDDQNKERILFQGEPDEMVFVRLKQDGDALVAEYSPYPRPHWLEESASRPVTREIIAEKVKSVSFVYADEVNGELEWDDSWVDEDDGEFRIDSMTRQSNSANSRTFEIPAAVQMTVEWENGTKEVWLRRSAGTAKNTQYQL